MSAHSLATSCVQEPLVSLAVTDSEFLVKCTTETWTYTYVCASVPLCARVCVHVWVKVFLLQISLLTNFSNKEPSQVDTMTPAPRMGRKQSSASSLWMRRTTSTATVRVGTTQAFLSG